MKLLDRYIAREIVFTTLFGVLVLTGVLVLGNLFKHDMPLGLMFSFIAYIIPFSLMYTIPWGFVTAVLLVFGKMSAENELIALRSSGVSITRICLPLFCMAMVFVGICLWINLDVAPRAQGNAKNAMVKIATQNPLSLFGSDHIIDEFPGRKIYVEGKNGTELRNLLVYEMDKDSNVMRVLFARKGELQSTNDALLLHIYDVRYEQHDPEAPNDWDKITEGVVMQESVFSISLAELYQKYGRLKVPSELTPAELWAEAKAFMAGPKNSYTASRLSSDLTEINKRFSFSLASFALALMAVPLAITAHRKETSIGFLISIIVASVYFFFIQLATMAQDNPKLHPEFLIWLPDVFFIVFGSVLFYRLSRQ